MRISGIAAIAATAAAALLCSSSVTLTSHASTAADGRARLPGRLDGANLTGYASTDVFSSPMADGTLRTLRQDGANSTAVVLECWEVHPASTAIDCDNAANKGAGLLTISDASVAHALRKARALGMAPILKPHVDLYDNTFRGEIAPADWTAWFQSYRTMMNRYATLADRNGAAMLVVGTELTSAQTCSTGPNPLTSAQCAHEWFTTIAQIRHRYAGPLTYAANWPDSATFPAWSRMDLIGVDGYFPLVNNTANPHLEPTVKQLVKGWSNFTDSAGVEHNWLQDLNRLHRKYDKPVIFTEVGYLRVVGAAAANPSSPADPSNLDVVAQTNAYTALFRAFADASWFRGALWWTFQADRTPAVDTDYDPRGNPAEEVLRDNWRS